MTRRDSSPPLYRWLDRLMAAIAVINLTLVAFDLSYIPFRNTYLRLLPELTTWYGDRFKGIEPHRDTTAYLRTVDALRRVEDLNSRQATALLNSLRTQSTEMIDQNPFEAVGKSGILERIKNRMRDHTRVENSAKQAFATFWSQEYLQRQGRERELAFFDRRIRPLIATNYYRGIDEDGQLIDLFWQIDIWFKLLFAIDLIVRIRHLRRLYPRTNWLDLLFWRWYDLFWFLPFYRWLRVIPTTVRLNHSGLVNLEPLRTRATHGFVTSLANELTEVVIINSLEGMQLLLRRADFSRWLVQSAARRRYLDLNGVDEIDAIARQLISLAVYQVLPEVRPEVESLMRYSVQQILQESPVYKGINFLPGMGQVSSQISEQLSDRLVSNLTETTYTTLTHALEDPQLVQQVRQLLTRSLETFGDALQQTEQSASDGKTAGQQIQSLLVDLLEEIKITYLNQFSEQDIQALREQNQHLYEVTQAGKLTKIDASKSS